MDPVKILIVEDEMVIARDLQRVLEGFDYSVIGIATSYPEGISHIKQDSPDLVLLDIRIKGSKSGIDIAKYLESETSIPFIFLSSFFDNETLEEAKSVKPAAYLTKPFREPELFMALELALGSRATNKWEARPKEGNLLEDGQDIKEASFLLPDSIFIRHKSTFHKIMINDICWLKGEGSYTSIESDKEKQLVRAYLKDFEKMCESGCLFRVHRSFIVNLEKITEIRSNAVVIKGTEIPIVKNIRDIILERLNTV